jgi:two-component system CheB/CheR fusion protein
VKKEPSNEAGITAKNPSSGEGKPFPTGESPTTGKTYEGKFPVVGIGASAGGLEAMVLFFTHLPRDTGMAFVVVTHQHPGQISLLPELLGRKTDVPVVLGDEGTPLQPDHIYICRPGGYLAILRGILHRMGESEPQSPHLPIDYFFRSLSEDQREMAVGIVLSGTGSDGTLGLKAIKGESGVTMVEDPQAAKYDGMPSSAIASGLVDYVLAPAEMPKQLVAYAKLPYLLGRIVAAELPVVPELSMQKIFVLLRSHTGNEFSSYKSSTLRRRIERRMNVHEITDPNHYVRYLQDNPHEIDFLFKELLVSVTNFFRDPEAWKVLSHKPLGQLLKSRAKNHVMRVWIPGCATGEEVFSTAIALSECMDWTKRHFKVQIFGTDLDVEAIERARSGLYPEGISADIAPDLLKRYFQQDDNGYRIRKGIREMAIFAAHNVIKDPPFTKLDMICCRNLLIYLNADLQRKLLPVFYYTLKPGGLLFLGSSETVGSFTDLFEVVDKTWRIYRRKDNPTQSVQFPEIPSQVIWSQKGKGTQNPLPEPPKDWRIDKVLEGCLLARFAPASVVVSDKGDVVYIHGRTGMYLELASGQPRNNLLGMAREGLQTDLALALRQAASTNREIVHTGIRVRTGDDFAEVDLTATKILEPETVRGLFLVTFRPTPDSNSVDPVAEETKVVAPGNQDRLEMLEGELTHTRKSLRSIIEEFETANEELQSTNEELQSTNEEIETSKEEILSLNEELRTVNAELLSKVDELSQANNDMQNLLNSTDIATIFLDTSLHVKRYTDKTRKLINLIPSDIGRSIGDLTSNLKLDKLDELTLVCSEVMETLAFHEREVQTTDGSWQLMRVIPYRTIENVIEGLVITFVNIDALKEIETKGSKARRYFENIVDTMRGPLIVLDDDLRVIFANLAFYRSFKTSARQAVGERIYELGSGQWDLPELRELLETIIPNNQPIEDFEIEGEFPKIGHRIFALNGRRVEQVADLPRLILLAFEDLTNS